MEQTINITDGHPLKGTVKISGAKNEVTKLMVASTLFDKPLEILNVPNIGDVEITAELMKNLGSAVHFHPDKHSLTIDSHGIHGHQAVFTQNNGNRLSILLAGPLLYRFGKAVVQKPGGCRIGERPLDLHLFYLRSLGVTIAEDDCLIHLSGSLRGATIEFPYKSVGATEGALLAALHAKGETIIKNAANEPEVIELIKILQRGGALIEMDAQNNLHLTGIEKPLVLRHPVTVMGDRVEAVSYAAAAVATGGQVELDGINQYSIITALTTLRKIGAKLDFDQQNILVSGSDDLHPLNIETDPHPALATDFQQVLTVLLSQAKGESMIHETVFDNRFAYLESLNQLGGKFSVSTKCSPFATCRFSDLHNHTAHIVGPMQFTGGTARITDLRAAFALVMAGLISPNETTLTDIHHLLRGYEDPIGKLHKLGANIKLASNP